MTDGESSSSASEWCAPGYASLVERPPVDLEQRLARQRVAVRAQVGRRQTDQHVAGAHVRASEHAVALDGADGEADEVELARLHRAGVLGHLAADQRAARDATAFGDAFDELFDVVGIEPADRDVVEEEQWLGALAHEVVDAHRDEVDADRGEPARRLGDQRLRADAVGRAHQHRVLVATLLRMRTVRRSRRCRR